VKSSKEDLAKQNAVQLLEIQVDLKRLAEIEQKLKAQEEVSAKLKSDNETLRSKDERRGQKKRKGDDVLRERERIALVRERDAEKIVTEYNSRLAVLEKREEAVGKLALSLSQSQAQVLSISQRLSQSQPPSPSQSPRPATVLHVKPKTEMERIRENLSPLRLEVMLRLINSIRGNNTAAYVCLQELLLDIANKTDRGTAEIVSSWHDQGVVTALATVPSNLSDTNGYTMPSPSASYPRDKTLHSFVILLENGTLLGRKDLTLCAQIAKYSKEYRAEYKTAENVSASASISASSSAFSFASPLPVSRTPSIRGGFGDHKR